jgi:SAM-dependent methyltransferase
LAHDHPTDARPNFDYGAEFGSFYHRARRLPPGAEEWIAQVRAGKIAQWISPGDRVLEYGVGFGWNLAAVRCAEKVGFDLTPGLAEAVESKGIRFQSDPSKLERSSYDVIILHHVLEHVSSPFQCLTLLKSLLRTNGKLLLFVPFEGELKYRRFILRHQAHHLSSWTPSSLTGLLIEAGWLIEQARLQKFRFDRFAALVAEKLRANFFVYRWVRTLGLFFLPEYEISVVARNSLMR